MTFVDCASLICDSESLNSEVDLFQLSPDNRNKNAVEVQSFARECPATIFAVSTIDLVRSKKLFRVLFDSGSSATLIKKASLPKGTVPRKLKNPKSLRTLAGKLSTDSVASLNDIQLPEFDKNVHVAKQRALIFDNLNCKYDIIFGTNFLSKTGLKLDYDKGEMQWIDNVLPMRPPNGLTSSDFKEMEESYYVQLEDEILGEDWLSCYATEILDAKYDKTDITETVSGLTHLNSSQQRDLLEVLKKNSCVFDGSLGRYPHKQFHIELEPYAKPIHTRPYTVPRIHLSMFKKELDHLVELGVLVPQNESEWASLVYHPKKDGRVRWISDLRQLNKVIKRKQYPLPIITDILRKRTGYKYFTKLDISM